MNCDIIYKNEFTINEIAKSMDELNDVLEKDCCDIIVVNITGVNHIDSAALQMLIATEKECEKKGKKLLLKASGEVKAFQSLMGIGISSQKGDKGTVQLFSE